MDIEIEVTGEELNVKAGDPVVRLFRRNGKWEPIKHYIPTVAKVTPKRIFVGDEPYDRAGRHAYNRSHYWITNDPKVIEYVRGLIAEERARKEQAEQERQATLARPTYRLACQIAQGSGCVADLELLGEEYLQRIVDDIAKAKGGE